MIDLAHNKSFLKINRIMEKPTIEKQIIIDPDLDERKKEGYYFTHFFCSNCDRPNMIYDGGIDVMIKKGLEIPKDEFECPNCGCLTLRKSN
jgi:predicted RNA-binding Zn-ribbon protein involved in translation (DUF1610 family)